MPKRHGLYQEPNKPLAMLFGIKEIVWLMVDAAFKDLCHKDPRIEDDTPKLRLQFSQHSFLHFSEAIERFLDALDIFQHYMNELEADFSLKDRPILSYMNNQRRAAMAADAVFQYLGILLDNIGRLVPFVILDNPKEYSCYASDRLKRCDSLFMTAKCAQQDPAFGEVRNVFSKLESSDSWWHIGHRLGAGMRQRITHNPDEPAHGNAMADTKDATALPFLMQPGGAPVPRDAPEVIGAIKAMLSDLCEWLDELEEVLFGVLQDRANALGTTLVRNQVFRSYVPVHRGSELRTFPRNDFLYMPLCAGSEWPAASGHWRAA